MATETERKFLIRNDSWRSAAGEGKNYRQGYLARGNSTVRVRTAGMHGFITVKGKGNGISRPEFEYEIPFSDAEEMFVLCTGSIISKKRFIVMHENHCWEIDVFEGENEGLLVAEIELTDENETFAIPEWAGEEVSTDGRYSNASLSQFPWKDWPR